MFRWRLFSLGSSSKCQGTISLCLEIPWDELCRGLVMIVLNVKMRVYLWGKCRYSQLFLQDKENPDCQLIFFFVRYLCYLKSFTVHFYLTSFICTKCEAREWLQIIHPRIKFKATYHPNVLAQRIHPSEVTVTLQPYCSPHFFNRRDHDIGNKTWNTQYLILSEQCAKTVSYTSNNLAVRQFENNEERHLCFCGPENRAHVILDYLPK